MNVQKFSVVILFLLMALGGIGGVMLMGYSIIIHS
ncbi:MULTISPECIES: protein YohO [Erwinia]|nr:MULTISPECIES: protein YohO [Erwinia]